jgi:hypothetical protein
LMTKASSKTVISGAVSILKRAMMLLCVYYRTEDIVIGLKENYCVILFKNSNIFPVYFMRPK